MDRTKKIMRGGSWVFRPEGARATAGRHHPGTRGDGLGFRVKKQIKFTTQRLRGGSWFSDQDVAHAAFGYYIHPNDHYDVVGFRVKRRRRNE